MRWLGHSASEIVRLYYHLHDTEAQRHMQKVDFAAEAAGSVAGEAKPEELEATKERAK